jgi:hypothetical protein
VAELHGACPYQKVHLTAHQHIRPRYLNAPCAVSSLWPSADLDVGAHVVLARIAPSLAETADVSGGATESQPSKPFTQDATQGGPKIGRHGATV